MIHREHRDRLALQLRRLASGRITNEQFEERVLSASPDPGVRAVIKAAWGLYSDLREHTLTGKDALTADERRHVARAVLFLHSDLEYRWPPYATMALLRDLASFLTAGRTRSSRAVLRPWAARGDKQVWPFADQKDLNQARRAPRFLVGPSVRAV
jgi:hypothetical protein